ncbi:MAG: hypothetical protein NVS4B8_23000 [Herpetosiphon sp.]
MGVREQELAGISEFQPTTDAVEECDTQFGLQYLDLAAKGGLGEMKLRRGTGYMAQPGDGLK